MEITCPQCGAHGNIDVSQRPENANFLRCPRCNAVVPFETAPSAAIPADHGVCALCQKSFPQDEMLAFGTSSVCAACKPTYVQMLEQGKTAPGALRYGGFWIRVAAKILDSLLLMVVNMVVTFVVMAAFMATNDPTMQIVGTIVQMLLQMAIGAAYVVYFLGKYQATPGKMACGLRVITPEGGDISYLRALGRHFAEMVSAIILGIGYIMAAFDEEKRSLHDRICSTRVVYK